ncbi:hypothetical protein IV203_014710 [Nitzschia inconspicua]|uniref:Uncharacterized protein n=1 Tax=Nitzschia inconspicua TaxID=303405 RepID=A0A9K3PSV0_9STRA|nr:hypothetical protein IV203_014710 [Nitzschia inconspicua]
MVSSPSADSAHAAAAIRLQSFVRGFQTRIKVSNMLDKLIQDMIKMQQQQRRHEEASHQKDAAESPQIADQQPKEKELSEQRQEKDEPNRTDLLHAEESSPQTQQSDLVEEAQPLPEPMNQDRETLARQGKSSPIKRRPSAEPKIADIDVTKELQSIWTTLDEEETHQRNNVETEIASPERSPPTKNVSEEKKEETVEMTSPDGTLPAKTIRATRTSTLSENKLAPAPISLTRSSNVAPPPIAELSPSNSPWNKGPKPTPAACAASMTSTTESPTVASIRDRKKAFWSAASKPTVVTSARKFQINHEEQDHARSPLPRDKSISKQPSVTNRYQPATHISKMPAKTNDAPAASPLANSKNFTPQMRTGNPSTTKQSGLEKFATPPTASESSNAGINIHPSSKSAVDHRSPTENTNDPKPFFPTKKEPSKKSVLDRFPAASNPSTEISKTAQPIMKKDPSSKSVLNRYPVANHRIGNMSRQLKKEQSLKIVDNSNPGAVISSSNPIIDRAQPQLVKELSSTSVSDQYNVAATSNNSSSTKTAIYKEPSTKSVLNQYNTASTASSPSPSRPTDFPRQRSKKLVWHPYGNDHDKPKIESAPSPKSTEFHRQQSQQLGFHPNRESNDKLTNSLAHEKTDNIALPNATSKVIGLQTTNKSLPSEKTTAFKESVPEADTPNTGNKAATDTPSLNGVGNRDQPEISVTRESASSVPHGQVKEVSSRSVMSRYSPVSSTVNNAKPTTLTSSGLVLNRYNPSTSNLNSTGGSSRNIVLPVKRRNNKMAWCVFGEQTTSTPKFGRQEPGKDSKATFSEERDKDTNEKGSQMDVANVTVKEDTGVETVEVSVDTNVTAINVTEAKEGSLSNSMKDAGDIAPAINTAMSDNPLKACLDAAKEDSFETKGSPSFNELEAFPENDPTGKSEQSHNPGKNLLGADEEEDKEVAKQEITITEDLEQEDVVVAFENKTVPKDDIKTMAQFTLTDLDPKREIETKTLKIVADNLCVDSNAPITGNSQVSENKNASHGSEAGNDNISTAEQDGNIGEESKDVVPMAASLDVLDRGNGMPPPRKAETSANANCSIRFDDSFNVVHEYETDVAAEHSDRLPLWWMKGVPHDILQDDDKDSDINIEYFPPPAASAETNTLQEE